jgi:hypothetical protein
MLAGGPFLHCRISGARHRSEGGDRVKKGDLIATALFLCIALGGLIFAAFSALFS